MRFADLHAHNHTKSFLWLRPQREKHIVKGEYHPWTVVSDSRSALKSRGMAGKYGQGDLVKLWNGRVRLAFNALYPIEKGFFSVSLEGIVGANRWYKGLTRLITSQGLPLRDTLQFFIMYIPDSMTDHFQSKAYDYWTFLNDEYEFAKRKEGQLTRNNIFTPTFWRQLFEIERNRRNKFPRELDATGRYNIPKDREELEQCLAGDDITMVLTIEGGHALGTDAGSVKDWLKHVMYIKQQWTHPVFFITFAHHFPNRLCGHAHSFPGKATFIMDQTPDMNTGFRPEGWAVIQRILSIDEDGEKDPRAGYRILIDVKHMSARSRKEYYTQIVRPALDKGDVIPVIASHVGYTGVGTLDELITGCKNEPDNAHAANGRYNRWNINICDEDVLMVHSTGGLIGLSFDQRILGVADVKENNVAILWANISGILNAIYSQKAPQYTLEEKSRIWECISIGTDFEGWIDPVDTYPTALFFKQYREDLIDVIEKARTAPKPDPCLVGINSITEVEQAVDRLCNGNAEAFVKRNYPNRG